MNTFCPPLPVFLALGLAALSVPCAAQSQIQSIDGGARGNNFGTEVAALGDVNADGFADFAVGSPYDNTAGINAGRVRVYSGKTGALLYSVNGLADGDFFGFSIAGIADTNGDGKAEILVGAPLSDAAAASAGQVRLLSGANGATLLTINGTTAGDEFGYSVAFGGTVSTIQRLVIGAPYRDHATASSGSVYLYDEFGSLLSEKLGTQAGENLGYSVAGGLDASGDGVPDFGGGSPHYDDNGSNAGRAKLFSGSSFSTLQTYASAGPGHQFGYSMAMVPDTNNDGSAEVLVGAPYFGGDQGAVYLHSGPTGAILSTKLGVGTTGHFGYSVSSAGDVTGDGRGDYVVGEPDYTAGGANGIVVLYNGSSGATLFTFNSSQAGARMGASVSGGTDISGDGRGDVVAGSPDAAPLCAEQGNVRVFNGSTHSQLYSIDGPADGDQLGRAVCALGDVNGDGYADYLVGSPDADHTHVVLPPLFTTDESAGSVKCISGATGLPLWTIWGTNDGDQLGYALVNVGDWNGDGKDDFAAGAPQEKTVTTQPGYVRICSGANGSTITTIAGIAADADFGYALGKMKDVTGDGKAELLIGAPGYNSNNGRVVRVASTTFATMAWTGSGVGERFGSAVAGIGDVTGDGKADVAIGAPSNDAVATNAGRVYIENGSAVALFSTLSGSTASENFGSSVAGLHFDYYDMLAIGCPGADASGLTDCGYVRTYFLSNMVPYTTTFGTGNFEYFGTAISNIGDYNLDGFDDYAVSSPGNVLFLAPGSVTVVSGYYGTAQYTFNGSTAGEGFGISMAGGKDINHDGTTDLIVGAPLNDANGVNSGSARVFSLQPQGVTYYGTGTPGCLGTQHLRASQAAHLNTYWVIVGADNAPAGALGLLLATDSPDYVGSDPFALGVTLNVDFVNATQVYGLDIQGIGAPNALSIISIGNTPALVGKHFYLQGLFAWNTCTLPPYNLSTTNAIDIQILN